MSPRISLFIFHIAVVLIGPIIMTGLINRVKSLWAGRRGPRIYQTYFDLARLLRKKPVYSEATSWIFPLSPPVVLASAFVASLLCPIVPGFSPLSFRADFIAFAYVLGLSKVFMILGALDTASAFEGMGASREATYSALVEPAILLGLATMAWASGTTSFAGLVNPDGPFLLDVSLRILVAIVVFMVLLVESSRVPADDPTTHLELTMVHEVMILDHSGPELAFMQYAAGIKMTALAGIFAAILNPFSATAGIGMAVLSASTSLVLMSAVAIAIGLIESLIARLRFRTLPLFILAGFVVAVLAMLLVNASREVLP